MTDPIDSLTKDVEKLKIQGDAPVKRLLIMRGVPGSGKSTLATKLTEAGKRYAEGLGESFSTDDYFMQNGTYEYNVKKIQQAHAWNQERAKKAMDKGVSPVVIDNTNLSAWEPKAYVEYGLSLGPCLLTQGYKVEIHEPETAWAKDAVELAKRNSHGVPLEAIVNMLGRYRRYCCSHPSYTVEEILADPGPPERKGRR